jgi:hypothetical protein
MKEIEFPGTSNFSEYPSKNWIFMESVVFLLFFSSIISMLGGTIQEPFIQKVNLGLLLTDPTKPQH